MWLPFFERDREGSVRNCYLCYLARVASGRGRAEPHYRQPTAVGKTSINRQHDKLNDTVDARQDNLSHNEPYPTPYDLKNKKKREGGRDRRRESRTKMERKLHACEVSISIDCTSCGATNSFSAAAAAMDFGKIYIPAGFVDKKGSVSHRFKGWRGVF